MDKKTEETAQKATSTPHTDDESITTSTESDSLETWTLVNDKNRVNQSNSSTTDKDKNDRIEVLTNFDDSLRDEGRKEAHESIDSRTDDDSNIDDVSEGISIISESDSAGRASPLVIAENFNTIDVNSYRTLEDISPASMLRLPIHIPQSSYTLPSTDKSADQNMLRQRRLRRSSSSVISERKELKSKDGSLLEASVVYPLVRRGIKGIFFVVAAIAIIAFIGKLRNPDWHPFSDTKNLAVLQQKLTDLELQNNLMRAEIDILSKQVNYLSNLNEGGRSYKDKFDKDQVAQQQRHYKQTGEWIMKQKEKTFKAWPGHGERLEPVQITKDELKKPFKCPNENFVEIAGMCVEKSEQHINNMDDIIKVVDDIVVNQIVEGIQTVKSAGESPEIYEPCAHAKKMVPKESGAEYRYNNYMNAGSKNSKERDRRNHNKKYETQKTWKQRKQLNSENDDDDDDDGDFCEEDDDFDTLQTLLQQHDFDDSVERFNKQKFTSKVNFNKHEQVRSNDGKYSKDRYQNGNFKGRSKERRFDGRSKDNRYFGSGEPTRKNGEWHEKLMQQRESSRRQNEFKQSNKNWYIERGNSREKMRHR